MAQIVTITNPLTGQPAKVDQLDHTAQQIDDGLNIARGVSNPNLLDNWYFVNPVDQRGGYVAPPGTTYINPSTFEAAGTTTGYVKVNYLYSEGNANITVDGSEYVVAKQYVVRGYTDTGYGIDRWKFDNNSGNATILITDDGIKFVNNSAATGIGALRQIIDPALYSALAGKTVTLSILGKSSKAQQVLFYVNDAVFAVKGSVGGNNARLTTLTATLPQTINNFSIYVYGASEAGAGEGYIPAAKLELGPQQTLAHQDENGVWVLNEIPDYGEQLARCQRYFQKYDNHIWFTLCKDNVWRASFTFPVAMREVPTVEFETISDVSANVVFDNRTKNGISGYASSSANYIAVKNLTLNANL